MNRQNRIGQLMQVTHLRYQADQRQLSQVASREAELRGRLQDLDVQRHKRLSTDDADGHLPLLMTVDLNWQQWVDQRRTALNAELTRVLAEKAECVVRLKRSFGKDQAAQALQKHATLAAKAAQLRRASQES